MSNKLWALIATAFFASACSTVTEIQKSTKDAQAQSDELMKAAKNAAATGAVWRTSQPKIAGDEVRVISEEKLPDLFNKVFPYVSPGQPIAAILEDISSQVGFPIISKATPQNEMSGSPGMNGQGNMGGASNAGPQIQIEWNGSFKKLLDFLGQKTNASWRFAGGQVEFFTEETRSFHIYLPRTARSISSSISLSGSGSGGGGGGGSAGGSSGSGGGSQPTGSVEVSSSASLDPYAAVVAGIQAIIQEGRPTSTASPSKAGSGAAGDSNRPMVIANRELGMITVTARPSAIRRTEEYVDSINKRFARNVLIDVKIFDVALNKEASAGISAEAMYKRLGDYGFSLVGSSILQPPSGVQPSSLTLGSQSADSRFNGSNLLVQAMQGVGDVSLVTSGQVIAVNGQPAPMQIANEVTFLASSSVTQTANAGTTTALVPGSRVVGFTANFLPLILGDNRILLEYQLTISSLKMNQVSSGGSTIQTPDVATRSLQQQAFLKDGQAIVLFGFDQTRAAANSSTSLGSVSQTGKHDRSMTVIVMQVYGGGA